MGAWEATPGYAVQAGGGRCCSPADSHLAAAASHLSCKQVETFLLFPSRARKSLSAYHSEPHKTRCIPHVQPAAQQHRSAGLLHPGSRQALLPTSQLLTSIFCFLSLIASILLCSSPCSCGEGKCQGGSCGVRAMIANMAGGQSDPLAVCRPALQLAPSRRCCRPLRCRRRVRQPAGACPHNH